jgi:citrate lyase subunit beta/citryl-CoA lyase
MITKAAGLEADSVILDLEDAVPEAEKEEARALVARLSGELDWGRKELGVRINPPGTRQFSKDIALVRRLRRVNAIVLPKAEGDCSAIYKRSGKRTIPIVETAKGLMRLRELAGSRGIVAMTYGAADYAASVGGTVEAYLDSEVLKVMVLAAAKSVRTDAVDNVFFDLEDSEEFRRQAMVARSLGFAGKQVIHPSQIAVANEVFSPSKEELEWAGTVTSEFERASAGRRGAIRVDGALVDAVHYRLAKELLEKKRQQDSQATGPQ